MNFKEIIKDKDTVAKLSLLLVIGYILLILNGIVYTSPFILGVSYFLIAIGSFSFGSFLAHILKK